MGTTSHRILEGKGSLIARDKGMTKIRVENTPFVKVNSNISFEAKLVT
jgi:hypothetical protein